MELPHACDGMREVLETEESALEYQPAVRDYTIAYTDGASVQRIDYCPFCGTQLPASLYDERIARLEEMGVEPFSDDVPPEYRDDRWWRATGS
jgi:hypothetical protein